MNDQRLILAGGGGHALSVVEALDNDSIIAGYTALSPSPDMPADWLGNDNDVAELAGKGFLFHMAFVYAGLPVMDKRRRLIEWYENAGAEFVSVIAPSAIVSRSQQSHFRPACDCQHRRNRGTRLPDWRQHVHRAGGCDWRRSLHRQRLLHRAWCKYPQRRDDSSRSDGGYGSSCDPQPS